MDLPLHGDRRRSVGLADRHGRTPVPSRSHRRAQMARSLRGALGWLESRVGTRRGGAEIFALALVVFGVRSIALPVIPGRDFETYLRYYVQMWDWHSVEPMSMLYRTPLAPLVIGGTLDLVGGWGLEILMALLFAASIVAWTRTSLVFGPRPALVTAAALLVYPGTGFSSTPRRASPSSPPRSPHGRSRSRAHGWHPASGVLRSSARPPRRRRWRGPRFKCSCWLRRCRSSFTCRGASGSFAPQLAPASCWESWGPGRS